MQHLRLAAALLAGALSFGAAAPARAGSFTPEGAFLFDPNAVALLDFEGPPGQGAPVPIEDKTAIHGHFVISVPATQGITVNSK
jgi:hypothetical protein